MRAASCALRAGIYPGTEQAEACWGCYGIDDAIEQGSTAVAV